MNWFKNLNATPRLMSSFGIVIALTLVISYLGVSGLSKSNDRINVLYNRAPASRCDDQHQRSRDRRRR
jgi:hypothetical protein